MTATRNEREEFLARLVREFPQHSISTLLDIGRKMLATAATLQRWAEEECNRVLTEDELKRDNAAQERMYRLAAEIGVQLLPVSGDPRGYVVKLLLPSGAYNSWGGEACGWGVPA